MSQNVTQSLQVKRSNSKTTLPVDQRYCAVSQERTAMIITYTTTG